MGVVVIVVEMLCSCMSNHPKKIARVRGPSHFFCQAFFLQNFLAGEPAKKKTKTNHKTAIKTKKQVKTHAPNVLHHGMLRPSREARQTLQGAAAGVVYSVHKNHDRRLDHRRGANAPEQAFI